MSVTDTATKIKKEQKRDINKMTDHKYRQNAVKRFSRFKNKGWEIQNQGHKNTLHVHHWHG